MRYITLDPNWENTAAWFARGFMFHDFEKYAKDPIISFIEQIRYLTIKEPEAVQRIIDGLKR